MLLKLSWRGKINLTQISHTCKTQLFRHTHSLFLTHTHINTLLHTHLHTLTHTHTIEIQKHPIFLSQSHTQTHKHSLSLSLLLFLSYSHTCTQSLGPTFSIPVAIADVLVVEAVVVRGGLGLGPWLQQVQVEVQVHACCQQGARQTQHGAVLCPEPGTRKKILRSLFYCGVINTRRSTLRGDCSDKGHN